MYQSVRSLFIVLEFGTKPKPVLERTEKTPTMQSCTCFVPIKLEYAQFFLANLWLFFWDHFGQSNFDPKLKNTTNLLVNPEFAG